MRAPDFWRAEARSPWPLLLTPVSWLWRAGGALRRRTPQRVAAKVVSVGNLVAGGAGKTPTVLALALHLTARGEAVHIVTRGYGGALKGPHLVDPDTDTFDAVGDEPLLLARVAPTWVSRDRLAGAEAAIKAGAKILLLDDAHQNTALYKDLSLLVVDAAYGFGNGRVIPAGPLRETITQGLARTDAVVQIGDGTIAEAAGLTRLNAVIEPDNDALRHKRVLAFAGMGRPEKFFDTLRALQCELVELHTFPDHHRYTPDEVMTLVEKAVALKALPVTTTKDAARLPPEARRMVTTLPVTLHFRDGRLLEALLAKAGIV